MRIQSAEVEEVALPLVEPFIISGGTMTTRRSLLVTLRDEDGRIGLGECPPFELPFYSEETLASARDLIERVLIPRLVGREFASPDAVDQRLQEGVRGNPFARAALETAAWDLEANQRGTGMARLLGERLEEPVAPAIPCGVALGIPADRRMDTLLGWVEDAIEAGYRRVKIKIAPGWDREPVREVAALARRRGVPVTVDANGAYQWPEDADQLAGLDTFGLLYIEQPLAPDELVGHVRLQQRLATPVCLDESLRNARVARQVMELEGPRVWNIKVHRVGGLSEVIRIYRIAREYGATLWAGTMPESGVGSQAALAAAALPLFRYPSDLEPSARWFGPGCDLVELTMDQEGMMRVPDRSIAALWNRG